MNSQILSEIGPALEETVTRRLVAADGTYHPVTLVTACAAISGLLLLRALPIDLAALDPSQPIVSAEVNERGAELVTLLMSTLADLKIDTASIDPKVPIPDDAKPERGLAELAMELEGGYTRIFDGARVPLADRPEYAIVVLAFFIQTATDADVGGLSVRTAFNIALNALMLASKSVPLRPEILQ